MIRTIHCTVVEVAEAGDSLERGRNTFEDLVPWGDPYIVALIEKLRRSQQLASDHDGERAELAPPLDSTDPEPDEPWQADWSIRNWPK